MLNWQKEYYSNFKRGMLISIAVHFLLLLFAYIISKSIKPDTSTEYYYAPYVSHLTVVNVGKVVVEGGGGSSGNRTDNIDAAASTKNLIAGIPVPGSDTSNVEFAMKTLLANAKDTASALGGKGAGSGTGKGIGDGIGNGQGYGFGNGLGSGFKQLPFMPRQTLEVLPQKAEDAKGMIVLALKIGLDGNVKDNKVILNTVNSADCLKYVLEAAYKSKWEKIKMEGQQIEYWIEKTYRFN